MCGLAGVFYPNGTPEEGHEVIRKMTSTLTHRGPDDCGYHVDARVVLGHRRLSIIDVKSGHQPIYNEDGSVCIVFNGEIYNFEEIRRELLGKGHVFRTNSDTETIVHAYEEWGERCVERLKGMFAFAVRDLRDNSLLLVRDRFGKKPLFYASYGGKFTFASEMKAILTDPTFDRTIDEEALASYFTFSYVPAPLTIFRGIRKLLPGHLLTVTAAEVKERKYWDVCFKPNSRRTEEEVTTEITARLADAVATRLVSEVPVGAFLSGGIDSSAVVAFMARASGEPVNTFTIGFATKGLAFKDERQYARLVAERYQTKHREYEVRPELAGVVAEIVRSFDEPFGDDSTLPSYFVCQMARQHVTVALSGLGGDEAFCGYERYLGFALGSLFARAPRFIKSRAAELVEFLPEGHSGNNRINHLKRFVRSSVEDEGRRYLGLVTKLAPQYRHHLFSGNGASYQRAAGAAEERFLAHYRSSDAEDPLDRVFHCDVKTYLPDDILALTDRISMRHSLEIRVPFLDHEFFEFSATIPSRQKMKRFRKKHLLKKALAPHLPPEVLAHRKQGFVGPLTRWLKEDLRPFTQEVLSPKRLDRHGLFERSTVARILADHFDGRETNDTLIWALIIFQTWYDLYVENVGGPANPEVGV